MAASILVLWGKNDDGQLGSRLSPCGSPTPYRRRSQEKANETAKTPTAAAPPPSSPTKPMMSTMRPAPGAGSRSSSPTRVQECMRRATAVGGSSTDAFAWTASPCRALSGMVVLQVSCGSRHTLARVEGGAAYSWGWGACGQLGHGDDHGTGSPREIEALKTGENDEPLGPVFWVSAGGIHSAAVIEGGCVFTWGGSSYGQLGLGPAVTTRGMQALPGKVMLSETESPTGSPRAACSTGLTRHSSMTQKAAVLAMDNAPKTELLAKVVVCGGMHTAALTKDGVVYCWGRADSGQLGIGAEWVHETTSGVMGVEWPRRVRGLLEGRTTASIACGGFHTAAVTTDGECYTWGKEDFGMLGCSNEALLKGGLFCPHQVALLHDPADAPAAPIEKVKAVACGGWHTAVVGEKGGVWTCGRGEYGRLGLGDQKSQWLLTPVPLGEDSRTPATAPAPALATPAPTSAGPANEKMGQDAVAAGTALPPPPPSNGGATVNGVEGVGGGSSQVVPPSPPLPLPATQAAAGAGTTDPASMVALGGSHSLVMTSSGKVYGFGRQEDGRLGVDLGGAEEIGTGCKLPVEISTLQLDGWNVQSISAGGVHSAAILTR